MKLIKNSSNPFFFGDIYPGAMSKQAKEFYATNSKVMVQQLGTFT
ncbi:hypothetical protein [Lutimonas sp.]